MLPILFKIGSFPIHTYGVLMVIAFLVALAFARKRATRYGISPNKLSDMAFVMLIAGVLGARILFLIQEPPRDWHEYFSIQFAGLTSFGGLIGGALVAIWWVWRKKMPMRPMLDVLGPPLLVGWAIGRVGCLMNGCCYGGVCPPNLPWALHIVVGGRTLPFHPAQIYDSLMNLAGLGIVLLVERRGVASGRIFAISLAANGLSRFIYEFWRAGTVAQVDAGYASSTYWGHLPITQAQAAAGLIVLFGVFLFIVFSRRSSTAPSSDPSPVPFAPPIESVAGVDGKA
ncbi:MAG TPA: prolipoprotein diacylglyceryl transferase [Fimbriimonadaceae bacterium]|nr:prolipoprotein diacylglyceryl transferase [Fimbriimonadaceae bacterium]